MFTAVWNYGVTSMTTWRQARRSSEQRARQRIAAAANGSGEEEMPAKTV
jgi:sensor domain CHASE-containing protein